MQPNAHVHLCKKSRLLGAWVYTRYAGVVDGNAGIDVGT